MSNKKKRYGTGTLVITLIVGLSIGVCAGYMIGSRSASEDTHMEQTENTTESESILNVEGETSEVVSTERPEDIEQIPEGGFAFDEEPVLMINDTTIYLDEMNARVYMARDHYVTQYGEEPWDTELENGLTVAEYAKNEMLEEMERVTILSEKAGDYQVERLTEEERAQCVDQADDYMASLGSAVANQFSVEREAVLRIYEKDAISLKVYNKILEDMADSLRAEDDYQDMEDSEFEAMLMEKFNEQYQEWKNDCQVETTETWEQLRIGAMG